MKLIYYTCCMAMLLCFLGCGEVYIYEKFEPINNSEWFFDDAIPFEFEITDTVQRYNLYLLVRHTTKYPYQNFWVNINTIFPDKTTQQQNVDLPMADKTGKWFGSGFNNIKTNEILIQPKAKMPQLGKYRLSIQQAMRYEPVVTIIDIGLRIQPVDTP